MCDSDSDSDSDYIPNVYDGFFCGECKRSLCYAPNECCRQSWRDKTYITKKVVVRIEEENPFADGSSCRECGTISLLPLRQRPAKKCCRDSWRDANPEVLIEAYEGYSCRYCGKRVVDVNKPLDSCCRESFLEDNDD